MSYEIVQIDPTVGYIITVDDTPMMSADGRPLRFYREIDAERTAEQILMQRRPPSPSTGPLLPNPGSHDERRRPPDPGMPEKRLTRRQRRTGRQDV